MAGKKKESGLTEKERKISEEVLEDVKKEIKEDAPEKRKKRGRIYGLASIFFGGAGLFIPQPFSALAGLIALILTRNAITNNQRILGLIGGILGLLSLISFAFSAGSVANWLGLV